MTTAFEGSGYSLDMHRLACLPTERVVISAALGPDGALQHVGGFPQKSELLKDDGFHALAVAKAQKEFNDHSTLSGGKQLLRAETLRGLLEDLDQRLGDRLYGPAEPLPAVLQEQNRQPEDPGPDRRSFDYRSSAYHAQQRLDELLRQAVLEPPNARKVEAPTLPLDIVCKRHNKGYVYVVGTAGSGKTSWALNLVRAGKSRRFSNDAQIRAIVLDGWFFARRFDVNGDSDAEAKRDEYNALQTVVSLARRHRGVVPTSLTLDLLDENQREGYRDRFYNGDANIGEILRAKFAAALAELARKASSQRPLVLLIDGVDEAKAARHAREAFLQILPTTADLPEHCYLILTSRPGHHVAWAADHNYQPILHYEFPQKDVQHEIHRYLDAIATNQERLSHGETAALLRDPRLRANVCMGSGRAFGYVPLLMGQWVRAPSDHRLDQLIAWRDRPGALPTGLYGLRANELLDAEAELPRLGDGILTDPLRNPDPSLTRLLALLAQMRVALEQDEFLDLLVGKTPVGERPSPQRIHHQLLLRVGGPFLEAAGTGSARPMLRFGHQSLAEIVQAAWRLRAHNNDVPATSAEIQAEALRSADEDARPLLTDDQRAQADAVLHLTLAQACQRWWHDEQVKPSIGPSATVRDAQAYALVWGPWHALKAAAAMTDSDAAQQLGTRARALLLNAGFIQSAIRAASQMARRRHEDADAEFLRQTYVAADKIAGDDLDRPLRHRIESNLLHWFAHIVLGRLQVGAMCWNLLGGLGQACNRATDWKDALDTDALIVDKPGVATEMKRLLRSVQVGAFSPCGQWLATSGFDGTEVWDLSEGAHRLRKIAHSPLRLNDIKCLATKAHLYVAGSSGESHVSVAALDLHSLNLHLSSFVTGARCSDVAICADGERLVLAAPTGLSSFALCSVSTSELVESGRRQFRDAAELLRGSMPQFDAGGEVRCLALQTAPDGVIVAIAKRTGGFETVGLHMFKSDAPHTTVRQRPDNFLVHVPFAEHHGHSGRVNSILGLSTPEGIIFTTGSDDGTIGLIAVPHAELRSCLSADPDFVDSRPTRWLTQLSGGEDPIASIDVQPHNGGILLASGSSKGTICMLHIASADLFVEGRSSELSLSRPRQMPVLREHRLRLHAVYLRICDAEIHLACAWEDHIVTISSFQHQSPALEGKRTEARQAVTQLKRDGDHKIVLSLGPQVVTVLSATEWRTSSGAVSALTYEEMHADYGYGQGFDFNVLLKLGIFSVLRDIKSSLSVFIRIVWEEWRWLIRQLFRGKLLPLLWRWMEVSSAATAPTNCQLTEFSGHLGEVFDVALFTSDETLFVASAAEDRTVGLVSVNHQVLDCRASRNDWQIDTRVSRYSGHGVVPSDFFDLAAKYPYLGEAGSRLKIWSGDGQCVVGLGTYLRERPPDKVSLLHVATADLLADAKAARRGWRRPVRGRFTSVDWGMPTALAALDADDTHLLLFGLRMSDFSPSIHRVRLEALSVQDHLHSAGATPQSDADSDAAGATRSLCSVSATPVVAGTGVVAIAGCIDSILEGDAEDVRERGLLLQVSALGGASESGVPVQNGSGGHIYVEDVDFSKSTAIQLFKEGLAVVGLGRAATLVSCTVLNSDLASGTAILEALPFALQQSKVTRVTRERLQVDEPIVVRAQPASGSQRELRLRWVGLSKGAVFTCNGLAMTDSPKVSIEHVCPFDIEGFTALDVAPLGADVVVVGTSRSCNVGLLNIKRYRAV